MGRGARPREAGRRGHVGVGGATRRGSAADDTGSGAAAGRPGRVPGQRSPDRSAGTRSTIRTRALPGVRGAPGRFAFGSVIDRSMLGACPVPSPAHGPGRGIHERRGVGHPAPIGTADGAVPGHQVGIGPWSFSAGGVGGGVRMVSRRARDATFHSATAGGSRPGRTAIRGRDAQTVRGGAPTGSGARGWSVRRRTGGREHGAVAESSSIDARFRCLVLMSWGCGGAYDDRAGRRVVGRGGPVDRDHRAHGVGA